MYDVLPASMLPVKKKPEDMQGAVVVEIPKISATRWLFYEGILQFLKGPSFVGSDSVLKGTDTTNPWIWTLAPRDTLVLGKRFAMFILGDSFQINEVIEAYKNLAEASISLYKTNNVKDVYREHGFEGLKKVIITARNNYLLDSCGAGEVEKEVGTL